MANEFDFLNRKQRRIFVIIVVVMTLLGPIIYYPLIEKDRQMFAGFSRLEFSDSLTGKIRELKYHRGYPYIIFCDNLKISIEYSRNYNYKPYGLDDFLVVGDILYKNKNCDTLYIRRERNTYYFVIGKFINDKR